jgi:cytochrome c oxidase accessory protein FixG
LTLRHRLNARIAPWRKLVQWLSAGLLLGIPFLKVGGESLLRLDAETRTLLFFGASIRIEEFYLFLLAVLVLVFGFLFVTMLFGRVWCGWLCPQTALCDLADWFDVKTSVLIPSRFLKAALRQFSYLALALLVACNLIWYFIAPPQFFARLVSGDIGTVAGISLGTVALLVYLDLALVRRRFCKTVCPYGRIQLLAMERGTLTLEFDPKLKGACLRCGACLKACPMGIDIRDGLQIECINCGRCLDACRGVMEKRQAKGLIHYSFGEVPAGETRRMNRKVLFLAALIVLLSALLTTGVLTRKEATLKVQRAANGEVKMLPDGSLVNFYAVYLENRAKTPGSFSLEVATLPGYRLALLGPVRDLKLAANENRKVDLMLRISPAPPGKRELVLKLVKEGRTVAATSLPLMIQSQGE